jgi:nucleotide-binding universal stress UspA family protein
MKSSSRKTALAKTPNFQTPRQQAAWPASRRSFIVPQKILVPVDFSTESTVAIKYAGAMARERGAEVTLLHVVEQIHCVKDYGYGPVNRWKTNAPAVKTAAVRLRALGRRHLASAPSWAAVVRSGNVCEEITKTALEMKSEMIVLPAHGLVRVSQFRSGNVAARVMHQSPCPVLTLSKPMLARGGRTQENL